MAFVIVGYAGYDLSAYKLPNWKAIANANREAEKADDSKSIPAEEVPSSPRPQPSPSYAASKPSIPQSSTPSGNGGGCYVATCVYGSYDCPEVWTLRRYRDDTLGATWYGRAFIRFYYAVSPTLVKWFGKTKWFKRLWKGKLDRMVLGLQARGIESTPYKDKQW